jgi:membrane protein YdbS with pleckstrin-like domain
MIETDSPSSKPLASTARLEAVIIMLTLLIKIGRYLPWIVLAFAGINMTLAVFYFAWWNNVAGGIVNLILAVAGFLFFGQLVGRRKIHRYNYRRARIDIPQQIDVTEQRKVGAEAT